MKTKILFLISIFVISGFLVGLNVFAQETDATDTTVEEAVTADENITAEDLEVSEPSILPNSPIYPLKDFWRKVRVKLTFNSVKKAELQLKFANERLIEVKKLVDKTGNEQILQGAMDKYQQEMEIVRNRIEAIKEKAADNPKIDEFLDKFTDKVIKQERLMNRLEQQLSDKPEVLETIRQNKERALEHLGETLNRLEDVDKIPERLEKNLKNIEGSQYKNFKNLEVLLELENKVPEQAKEAIQQAQENALKRLHSDLNNMSSEDQAKFKDYLEGVGGNENTQVEIIDKLQQKVENRTLPPALNQNLNQAKQRAKERIQEFRQNCKNLCGDGKCQQIVCQAIGCPCAETAATCPQDCK